MFYTAGIVLICILGMLTSYTDIKRGKIPNKFVFPMISAGTILALLNPSTLALFAINALFAFAFGFVLYLAKLWSAGDSKLFLAFAMLLPAAFYPATFAIFPSFAIILNSFIPAFAALFIMSIVKTGNNEKLQALKQALNPKTLASLAVILFFFYWLLYAIFSFISFPADFFLMVLLLYAIVSLIEKAFPRKIMLVSAVGGSLLGAIYIQQVLQPYFQFAFAIIFISMVFLRFFVLYLGFFAFGKRVETVDLKQGMVLLEGVYEKDGNLEKKKLFFPSIINAMQDIGTNYIFDLSSKGLSKQDIELLQKKKKEGKVKFHSLLVQETLPFAPLLFIGTLLTLFWQLLPWF